MKKDGGVQTSTSYGKLDVFFKSQSTSSQLRATRSCCHHRDVQFLFFKKTISVSPWWRYKGFGFFLTDESFSKCRIATDHRNR